MVEPKGRGALVIQIREAMRASGRSLRDLEKATGISRGLLSRFLRGERDMTLTTAAPLLEALGLTIVPQKPKRPAK
jgi:transcriptional regulator with XRE-family HTH domain